ncbi:MULTISPECIES: hypothetical protein [Sphingopyxis]|jgi:hypothetical protein|uniref:Uncharacterized protein n=1 Tax=Sphingopyxis macrogoltabida TaxID=33050 RepID=A0A0N9UZ21_SPHMC|nr:MULTISPECIES: hypothetical protein [Sphingopyxis]ALH81551.1 hypothetical protein AN936_14665 [Sphingopyxis macrogoltabida]KTE17008.1 hypothetical protein ATE71_03175 [Sphingopyxis sp. H115]
MAVKQARPNHIAELTSGVRLPLVQIDDRHLKIILETISLAWHELLANGAPALLSGDEAEVNALLEPRLNHFCQTQKLWKDLVHSVHRGRESMSYNGAKIEGRPDLSLVFTVGNRNFPFLVECKIIDHPNAKRVSLYCKEGIARFVAGEYAWAHRSAIMLAYVRDGSSVTSRLAPHLIKCARARSDTMQTLSHPVARPDLHPTAQQSSHRRDFRYVGDSYSCEPGPISLFHLWL